MSEDFTCDVLICGAGASGLTLAIDLARRGASFRLIEKLDGPFTGSRGKGIQPRTQEVFEDLGILDRLVSAGGLYPPQRSHRPDGSFEDSNMMELAAPTVAEPYQLALMSPQFLTERILRERLQELGGCVEQAVELTAFQQTDSAVIAQLLTSNGPQEVRVRYLIGADGGRSFVRHALGVEFLGKTLGVRAVVADVLLTGLDRDAWHRFNDGNMAQQISFCPLAGTDLFVLQAPVPLEGDVALEAADLTQMTIERTGRTDIVVTEVRWASAFNMNARLADRYQVGRVFLIGDAAHTHPPTGGQGLNTSVQDAYNLGWKLAAVLNGAPAVLLESYEEERRAVAAGMLGLATKLLSDMKQGQMKRGREVHQLDLSYAGSSLAVQQDGRTAPLAGDRAPDALLRGAGGQPRRLFDLFQGPHWTLLMYESGHHFAARKHLRIFRIGEKGDLLDTEGHFRAAYAPALRGTWFLIRPDGYIGAVFSASQEVEMESYLEKVGLRGNCW